jgi:hypothetical protein
MPISITRKVHVSQEVELEFTVRDLVESLSDDEIREAGLFRDLNDADIARIRLLNEQQRQLIAMNNLTCDDDECDCAVHFRRVGRANEPGHVEPEAETAFWPMVRALALRGDRQAILREFEQRAWLCGNTTIDLGRVMGAA